MWRNLSTGCHGGAVHVPVFSPNELRQYSCQPLIRRGNRVSSSTRLLLRGGPAWFLQLLYLVACRSLRLPMRMDLPCISYCIEVEYRHNQALRWNRLLHRAAIISGSPSNNLAQKLAVSPHSTHYVVRCRDIRSGFGLLVSIVGSFGCQVAASFSSKDSS